MILTFAGTVEPQGGGQEESRMAEGAGLDAQITAMTVFKDSARVQHSGRWAHHQVALLATGALSCDAACVVAPRWRLGDEIPIPLRAQICHAFHCAPW
jgi:hypothetical protein